MVATNSLAFGEEGCVFEPLGRVQRQSAPCGSKFVFFFTSKSHVSPSLYDLDFFR